MSKVLKGEVCWKVVQKDSSITGDTVYGSGWVKSCNPFYLPYRKNHITKRKKGTIGVFAFSSKDEAYNRCLTNGIVMKAIGFGKKEIPLVIAYADSVEKFYKTELKKMNDPNYVKGLSFGIQKPWEGTVLYEALTIIED